MIIVLCFLQLIFILMLHLGNRRLGRINHYLSNTTLYEIHIRTKKKGKK